MRLFIEKGEFSQAREYYDKLTKLMQALDRIGPPPSITALYQEIKGDSHVDVPEPKLSWDIHPCVQVPLVGREKIFKKLDISRKQGQSVLLFGEAGKGKTRLIKEYSEKVSAWKNVLHVSCKPNEANLPYQPLISLFRHEIVPSLWLELSPAWAASLSQILPEISMMRNDIIEEPGIAREMNVLMEAIRQVFKHLDSQKSLLLVIDDIHYADWNTLQTFTYLMERFPFKNESSMLVGTARESEFAAKNPDLLNSLYNSKYVNVIKLQGLCPKAISEIVYYVLQESPSSHFISSLSKESGGNPLYILEMLRIILDTGTKPDFDLQDGFPVSERLSHLIGRRLAGLSEEAYRVFESAAVLGSEFELDLLPFVAKTDDEEIIQAIEELTQNNLIIEMDEQKERGVKYRFAHRVFHEVLVQRMSSARRLILHNRAAHFKIDEGAEPAIIATHFEDAKKFEAAFYYWIRAGERARMLASAEEASRAFQRAECLLIDHDLLPASVHLYKLFSTWGAIAFETQEIDLMERLNDSLLRFGEERGDNLLIGTALGNASDAYRANGQFKKGLDCVNRALDVLDEKKHLTEVIENLVRKGIFHYVVNEVSLAEETFQDALALGMDRDESPEVFNALANAHAQMGFSNLLNVRPSRGLKHAKLTLDYAKNGNHPHRQLMAHVLISLSRFYFGEYEKGRLVSEDGFFLVQRIYAYRLKGYLHISRALIELAQGNISKALEHISKAVQIGKTFSYYDVQAIGYRIRGDIYCLLQAYSSASKEYKAGYNIAREHFLGFDNCIRLGLALALMGEMKRGCNLIEDAMGRLKATTVKTGVILALMAKQEVALLEEDLDRAKRLNLKSQKLLENSDCLPYLLSNKILLGKIKFQEGDWDQAESCFCDVSKRSSAMMNPWIELESQLCWEKCLKAMEKDSTAQEKRIIQLLDHIRSGIKEDPYIKHYQNFRQLVLAREAKPILYF